MSTVNLELSIQDARFLLEELQRHIGARDNELVHTDAHGLQHAIAADVARLGTIHQRLARALEAQATVPTRP
jgi:hypothetical protein